MLTAQRIINSRKGQCEKSPKITVGSEAERTKLQNTRAPRARVKTTTQAPVFDFHGADRDSSGMTKGVDLVVVGRGGVFGGMRGWWPRFRRCFEAPWGLSPLCSPSASASPSPSPASPFFFAFSFSFFPSPAPLMAHTNVEPPPGLRGVDFQSLRVGG